VTAPALGVRVFESEVCPADRAVVALLEEQLAGADLAGPAVALPDLYRKPVMESPSSIAVAMRDTIRPTLTSAALNCGMALVAIDVGRPNLSAVREFLGAVRAAYPFPPGLRRVLSADEVIGCASGGAVFASEMVGLDPAECERFEEGGRIPVEPYGGTARVRRELGRIATQLSRLRFGTIGPNTHFVELQAVEDVFDPAAARALGVERGQVTLQYHGGDGVLNIQMGARFGRRLAGSRSLRAVMAVQKPLYQLASARSAEQVRRRAGLYFSGGCPPVPRDGEEGERLMLSVAMAMNYGFAYRRATFATLAQLARRHLGAAPRLVFDSPHNTIYEEAVDGVMSVVHRHNAARALPPSRLRGHPVFASTGQPVLLPGTNRTCSYLCVADEGAVDSLCSANHGTGSIIADFVRRGRSGPDPHGRTTLRVRYGGAGEEVVPHLDDAGVDEGLRILVDHRIVRPVARLRPFAGLT
jgi:RNA-splicing ligase RtcB